MSSTKKKKKTKNCLCATLIWKQVLLYYPVEDSVHKLFLDYRKKGLIQKDHLIDPAWSVFQRQKLEVYYNELHILISKRK